MIVRIVVPATTERIIVILMSENQQLNEMQQLTGQEVQPFTTQRELQSFAVVSVPSSQETEANQDRSSEENDPLVSYARLKARSDVRDMKRRASGGKVVVIDHPKLDERIEALVDMYFEYLVARGEAMPVGQACREQERQFRDAYLKSLREGINGEQVAIRIIDNPLEMRLRELAIQDKQQFPSPWRRPFHQRDLAVIQVLLELGISLDRARQELETIHDHADIYEKYYANPREEVSWPGDSF